jgi:hypothetical protein
MPTHRNELRFPPYEDVPKLCPVFIVLVDEKGYLGYSYDVPQTRESFRCDPLRFFVYSRVENFAIICKAHRHDVWSMPRIHRGKPRNPSIFQFCLNRAGNLLARHTRAFEQPNLSQAASGAFLSSSAMISSRLTSGIAKTARWMPASRYSASAALSAGAPNTLIESVEKSRPAAEAA